MLKVPNGLRLKHYPNPQGEERQSFAVLGAGHGGIALAGYLALCGARVNLYNRSYGNIRDIAVHGGIEVNGIVQGVGKLNIVSDDLRKVLSGVNIIMVVVPAFAHRDIALACAPYLEDDQIIVLNPGRTGGVLLFKKILREAGCTKAVTVAEAQTFIFASRRTGPTSAHIYGKKREVPVAALPAIENNRVLLALKQWLPELVPARSVLETSLGNIGAIFHPAPTILNSARIESNSSFDYYTEGVTPAVARVLEKIDRERTQVAAALGARTFSAVQWLRRVYGAKGLSLYEAIHNNSAYEGIGAPTDLMHRYILEDIPTGLVPISNLGDLVGIPTPTINNIVNLACAMFDRDFWEEGRTLRDLGLEGRSPRSVRQLVMEGDDELETKQDDTGSIPG